MAKIELKPLHDAVSNGEPRKGEVFRHMTYGDCNMFQNAGVNAIDLIYLNPGDEILPHGHNPGEAETWLIFRGDGVCEIQLCEKGEEHCIHNDTDRVWAVIGVKTNAQIQLPNTEVDWVEFQ